MSSGVSFLLERHRRSPSPVIPATPQLVNPATPRIRRFRHSSLVIPSPFERYGVLALDTKRSPSLRHSRESGNPGVVGDRATTDPVVPLAFTRTRYEVSIHHEKVSTICSISASSRSRKVSMNCPVSGLASLATSLKKGSGSVPARLAARCRKASETMMSR
jgi:hypothetical protein